MKTKERDELLQKCDDIIHRIYTIKIHLHYGITSEDRAFLELVSELLEQDE